MTFLHKPRRVTDEEFLDFIRSMSCCVQSPRCLGVVDPHHVKTRGAGGSDYTAVPLCRSHHDGVHGAGLTTFQKLAGVDLWQVAAECLAAYIVKLKEASHEFRHRD